MTFKVYSSMSKHKQLYKILLCSPREGSGGISMWTHNILEYYNNIMSSDVSLKWKYATLHKREVLADTSILARFYYGLRNYIPFLRMLRTELKHGRFDLVHFSSSASISLIKDLLSIKIAHRYGTKAVMHFHFGRIPQFLEQNNWEAKLLRKVLNLADGIIVLDEKSYNALKAQGYKKIYKLPNPLSPTIQTLILNSSHIQRRNSEILFVGHIVESKGIEELLMALDGFDNITLNVIGKGSSVYIDELKNKYSSSCNVNFLGVQPINNVIMNMMSCSVFVLPTYTEGFPNVIIESMACGCPIVTTDVGAIPEMLDINNGANYGICVKPKQVSELRDAIKVMLENKEYASSCGEKARLRVQNLYSMPIVWNKLCSIWKETSDKEL